MAKKRAKFCSFFQKLSPWFKEKGLSYRKRNSNFTLNLKDTKDTTSYSEKYVYLLTKQQKNDTKKYVAKNEMESYMFFFF